jgi:hypothetical protein
MNGECKCELGFSGEDCSVRECPNKCSGNGQCIDENQCLCNKGWSGPDCSIK